MVTPFFSLKNEAKSIVGNSNNLIRTFDLYNLLSLYTIFEGEVFSAYAMEKENSIRIFCFNSMRAHFYTPSATEKDLVEDLADFQSEGIADYVILET